MYEQHNYKKRITLTAIAAIFLAATLVVGGTVAVTTAVRPAYAITFGSTKNISNNDGDSTNPQVQVSSSNVYAVWEDETKADGDTFFQMYHTFPFTHDIYIL